MNGAPAVRARHARRVTLAARGARLAIAALCLCWTAWHLQRLGGGAALLAVALGVLPWLALLPSLARGSRRGAVLALLLTLPYLAYGLMEVLSNPGARAWAAATALLAVAGFATLVGWLRVSRAATPGPTSRTAP